jgi:hypothetical protein
MGELSRRQFLGSSIALPLASGAPADARLEEPGAEYLLRYFIRSNTAERQTRDLIAYCRANRIGHVILFNGNHWDLGWNLPTLEEASARVEVLKPVFAELRNAGLRASLNMWTTIGHEDLGRHERARFPGWRFLVGDDGAQSRACPCPLDPGWNVYIRKLYASFAALEPDILYIDDDFRYHNHRPAAWSCFCPLHLDEMARRTGRPLDRVEVLARILTAEPQPSPERDTWLALCGESILSVARGISEAVARVSPRTRMGLMCSLPEVHAAEGRLWLKMAEAFAVSGNAPVLRPHMGGYGDAVFRDTASGLSSMRKLQPLLGARMRFTPEVENDPCTAFSKSARGTRLQIALNCALGCRGVTLDIHSFTETAFDYDTALDPMLRDSFEYFDRIARWAAETPRERGLQVLWDNRFPRHRRCAGSARMAALVAPHCWEGAMDLLGFATTFYPDEVRLASRPYLEERTDREIGELLGGKMLLPADAAALLIERGFAADIGVASCAPLQGANVERLTNEQFAGRYFGRDMTAAFFTKYRLEPLAGAAIVSTLLGPEESFRAPGMLLYENRRGGRVGILPYDGAAQDLYRIEFRNWKRQHALWKMIEWIAGAPVPLFVENAADVWPLRRDGAGVIAIALANLSADPLRSVTLRVGGRFERPAVEVLTPAGLATPPFEVRADGGYTRLRGPVDIEPYTLACFRVTGARA